MTSAFYKIYRWGVRVIRYILGTSPRNRQSVPLLVPKQLYYQLRAIAAHQYQCPPNKLHHADVAATVADLIELGLRQTASAQRPSQVASLADQSQILTTLAALQNRLAQLETEIVRLSRGIEHRSGDRSDLSHPTTAQIFSRLDIMTQQLSKLEARNSHLLHSQNSQAASHNTQQMQHLSTHLQQLQAGMEQMTAQHLDWHQTFSTAQQQIRELNQQLKELSQQQAKLRSGLSAQAELVKQETRPLPWPSYGTNSATSRPAPKSYIQDVSTASLRRSSAFPSRQPSPGNTDAAGPSLHQPKPDSVIDAEILDTSSLNTAELKQQNFLDVDGITQLELCKRFGFSHHTLVRDSRKAGFSSVHRYLEAKTGFRAQQVGRWWRYYSGER